MVLPEHLVTLMYHAKRCNSEHIDKDKSLTYVENHRATFEELFDIVLEFTNQFIKADSKVKEIKELFEKNKETDIKEVAQSFVNLMTLNSFGVPTDFKFFGKTITRNRYTSVQEIFTGVLIDQSITGLYETRRRLDS